MISKPWPLNIRVKRSERALEIDFDDGSHFSIPAELLRVESPSAEVQGHGEGKTIVGGKRKVTIDNIEPVGNYAVAIHFDDGHNTGLYSWDYLYQLASKQAEIWESYIESLASNGLSR